MCKKTILAAIDSSEAAECRAADAAELAQQLGARLILLHVIDVNAVANAWFAAHEYVPTHTLAELKHAAEFLLERTLEHLSTDVRVQTLILEGDAADTIVEAATSCHADFVFLGSDSRGRLAHFLVGSTTDAVIRRANCPIVTVRRDPERLRIPQHRTTDARVAST